MNKIKPRKAVHANVGRLRNYMTVIHINDEHQRGRPIRHGNRTNMSYINYRIWTYL